MSAVDDMTAAMIGALHDQLRASGVNASVAQVTDAVNAGMAVLQYDQLSGAIAAADALVTAIGVDYPAGPGAHTTAALTGYGTSKSGFRGVNTEIP